jgi:hypothetical protein
LIPFIGRFVGLRRRLAAEPRRDADDRRQDPLDERVEAGQRHRRLLLDIGGDILVAAPVLLPVLRPATCRCNEQRLCRDAGDQRRSRRAPRRSRVEVLAKGHRDLPFR